MFAALFGAYSPEDLIPREKHVRHDLLIVSRSRRERYKIMKN
jgi:hypothetical protein